MIEAVSAARIVLPLMLINKGEAHYMVWYAALQKGDQATFSYSKKGSTNQELGVEWQEKNFELSTIILCNRVQEKYWLLLLDSHTLHLTWEFFNFCLSRLLIPLYFPSHSTHLLQPLDVGLFGPLQHFYSMGLDK
ncbi:CENP-B protein [Tuber magnatum]|uniref:CENP-B protein n=1 Tax=Tuber magnatum TaxID=42249 RepID=A0A317SXQ8_9PEZI|nr:CENP-B protein [Tuber magnatum]